MTSSAYNLTVDKILFGFCTIISGKSRVDGGYHIKFMQGYLNGLLLAGREVLRNMNSSELSRIVYQYPLYINIVQEVTHSTYLGLTINSMQSWSEHIQQITSKLTGHSTKLLQLDTRVDLCLHSFFLSAIKVWNNLPNNLVTCSSVDQFKARLAEHQL